MPTPIMEIFGLWESDVDDVYNLPAKVSDDNFWGGGSRRRLLGKGGPGDSPVPYEIRETLDYGCPMTGP